MKYNLSDICDYAKGKINVSVLDEDTYISTENMMPNKGGITGASSLPTVAQTQSFSAGDVLVSNIRPYFKKIWFAEFDGGCSNDVLVFRTKEGVSKRFLYYVLADDTFFNYSMATSKGTKMPRGDKAAIMKYQVPDFTYEEQEKIAGLLEALDKKIQLNAEINENLEQQVQAIFRSRFLTQEALHDGWVKSTLGDVSIMGAGGDKPKTVSATQTENCPYPIYSNGISDEGLYGFTNEYKIEDESITVSARGTIGYVCLRHLPYTPIVRLVTLIPKKEVVSAKYLYLWLRNTHIHGTGTTQQQLTVPDFRKTEIILPTKEEMVSFTGVVSPLFETMWANQAENAKLADLRDTLLPRLVSGELDVSDIDL